MHFPKLSPLQSRFAGSLIATLLLVLIYLSITNPQFAYAAAASPEEGFSRPWSDSPPEQQQQQQHTGEHRIEGGVVGWRDGVDGLDQGILGRAPSGVAVLATSGAKEMNITSGELQYWVVENTRSPFITLNTCTQPSSDAPQLQLFVSTSSNNQNPGPNNTRDSNKQEATGGYISYNHPQNSASDVYIGVYAPGNQGVYSYEIAASTNAPYHSYNSSDVPAVTDSDSNSALLVANITALTGMNKSDPGYQAWESLTPPFVIFTYKKDDPLIKGLQGSYCGLKKYAQIAAVSDKDAVNISMTTKVFEDPPWITFHITGLQNSTSYSLSLGIPGNSTAEGLGVISGGGKLWKSKEIMTKSGEFLYPTDADHRTNSAVDGNCQIISQLKFCNEVAYAVPSNPQNASDLGSWYDQKALDYYKGFNYSIQQVACNTTSSAQYSLVRTCEDCKTAYKRWLCAVTIPRCEDYSSANSALFDRNVNKTFLNGTSPPFDYQHRISDPNNKYTNSSRNPAIDAEIQPGPYKELLPCVDLCHDLVRSCPPVLGFSCPSGNELFFSYQTWKSNGPLACNPLGLGRLTNTGATIGPPAMTRMALLCFVGFWLWYSF